MSKLLIRGITRFIMGFLLVFLLIFIPAGSLEFYNGWLLIIILFIPMFIFGLFLFFKNPELLKIRLNVKEKERDQKEVIISSGIMFIIGFVLAGLNYRYNWFMLPKSISIIASIIFLISYILYAEVLRENTFLSRTIEVTNNQKVVDTGMYSIVRHPMYIVTIVLFLMMPLVLGSLISFIVFLVYPFLIVKRIKNEEKVLEKDLDGYKEYEKKVKYRLIPYIW
ncbi:MAG: isoprenylcysteine carboxylmethyltransferase family protein [Bacilli bacterium]|nr:isoprenylcysteine carboxylmethyltransferase family protein [Bacilli bacterium]